MRKRTKRDGLIKWFLLIATTLVMISEVAAQTYVKRGIISPTFGHAPFYVARDKGFFRNEGLVGEVIVMNRDDLILQSLVADSIQFGNISPSALFPAREQGLTNLKMTAGSFNGTTYSIIALPKFKTLEQLRRETRGLQPAGGFDPGTEVYSQAERTALPSGLQLAASRWNDPPLRRFANPTGGRGYPGGAGEPYRPGERVNESGRCV